METHRCQIPGYQVLALIHESSDTEVYQAVRAQDRRPVILKMLKPTHTTPISLNRYRHEYEMTRSLNVENVIKAHGLESYEQTLVLVLEDFGGASLNQWMREWQRAGTEALPVSKFLTLAICIVDGLIHIHETGVIHKNLTPQNIVLNPTTDELKIIDFGIATTLSRETPFLKHPGGLEGTLVYLSPEQSGRMNRTVDYRTDFYSLGVMFYEMLTGRLPFESTDAMELVHAHLAKTPACASCAESGDPADTLRSRAETHGKSAGRSLSERARSQTGFECMPPAIADAHGNIPPFHVWTGRSD